MRSRLCLTALFAAGFIAGCAQERAPINRVQPNALPKSFFVGKDLQDPKDDPEFYFRANLVNVPYGEGQEGLFTSSYGAAEMVRVKFVIQETFLVARLSYERINNSDHRGVGASSTDGMIVAVYPILSHFDIKRDYNPTTGEEMNVIGENTTDRPWNEREYMRVDFSKNLNVDSYDYDTLSLLGLFGGVTYTPLAYYVNDPTSEDAPHFDEASGYFDVTNKVFASPNMIDLSYLGWGVAKFPACMLDGDVGGGGFPVTACSPIELTIRNSFRRVVDSDFEPLEWDGLKFKAYGTFYKERYGYSRGYGTLTDDQWHRLMQHYQIWQRSHYYDDPQGMTGEVSCYTVEKTHVGEDPHRDISPKNGTEDECEEVTTKLVDATHPNGIGGSKCDPFNHKCTLPLRARQEKSVVWYVTTGSNPEYFDGTAWATHEWDVAFRMAVQFGRYAECVATGDTGCATAYPVFHGQMDDVQEAVRLASDVDDCRHHAAAYASDFAADASCAGVADRLGGERALDPAIIAIAKMQEMVVLCHSPVEANDPEVCGTPRLSSDMTAADCYTARVNHDSATLAKCNTALNARIGDLRFHNITNIAAPEDEGMWGIMMDSADPLTGETVSASVNVWTHATDQWSQGVVDLARVIKGEIKVQDLTEGAYIKDWTQANARGGSAGAVPKLTAGQLQQRVLDGILQQAPTAQTQAPLSAEVRRKLRFAAQQIKKSHFDATAPTTTAAKYAARAQAAMGTTVEAELTTAAMQQRVGVAPGAADTEAILTLASPFRGGDPLLSREIHRRLDLALAQRGACAQEAPVPLANAQLADVLEAKFGNFNPSDTKDAQFARAEKMRKFIAQKAHHSVIVHEMGHSIGLRHNFLSSSDAYAYRPQYWQLRTRDGTVTKKCAAKCTVATDCPDPINDKCVKFDPADSSNTCVIPGSDGDADQVRETVVDETAAADCIGPRWFDPTTPAERTGLIWMWMQSSTMDYAGETTQDMLGLGMWDYAAARMLYGNAVSVLQDSTIRAGSATIATPSTPKARSILDQIDNFGFMTGIQWSEFHSNTSHDPTNFHYSQLQNEFTLDKGEGLIHDCKAVTPETFKPPAWDATKYGDWNALIDGHFVSPNADGKYTACRTPSVDYVTWDMLSMPVGQPRDDGSLGLVSPSGQEPDEYTGGPSIDPSGRLRVPYGFATDTWADLGNTSVYRHDNGADIYELFDFFISQQETQHIFANYRRGRQTFSVRAASDRALTRYNEKMRDSAKGMAFLANIYRDFAQELGYPFDSLWADVGKRFYSTNILASTVAMDFFTRQMDRPSSGPHYFNQFIVDPILRSKLDVLLDPTFFAVTVPDGAYGVGGSNASAWGNVGYGGRLLENMLGQDWKYGEYATDYTLNCGSYYDKAFTPMLLTESADNFISYRRRDFVDPRYRAISMADLFPDGFRRWLGNNLTGEDGLKGPRVAAHNGRPLVEMPECDKAPCQICGGLEPACAAGSKCCANARLGTPFATGLCVTGDTCPASCGFEDQNDPTNKDPTCPVDPNTLLPNMCCQGLCTTGQCFLDTSKGVGWTTWVPAAGPQVCFWSNESMEHPDPIAGGAICTADPKLASDTVTLDPQVGWEQQKFLIAMTMQYLPENQFQTWMDQMTVWELGKDADPVFNNRIEFHDPNGAVFVAKTFGRETLMGQNVEKGVAARVLEYANELLFAAYDCNQVPASAGPNDTKWYVPNLDPATGQPIVKSCPGGGPGSCKCEDSPDCVSLVRYTSVPAFFRQVMAAYAQGDPSMRGIY